MYFYTCLCYISKCHKNYNKYASLTSIYSKRKTKVQKGREQPKNMQPVKMTPIFKLATIVLSYYFGFCCKGYLYYSKDSIVCSREGKESRKHHQVASTTQSSSQV
jgi:capsule polysaccharide export protein KpsE/RkpR